MTTQSAQIIINNPCSENWNLMNVNSVGRFCDSCQKSVIDFTSKTDYEIRKFLKNKHGKKLCGRFHVHQINRVRIEIDQEILKSDIPYWQKFLVIILVCFGPHLLDIDFVFAQTTSDTLINQTEQNHTISTLLPIEADTNEIVNTRSLKKNSACKIKSNDKNDWTIHFDNEIIMGNMVVEKTFIDFHLPSDIDLVEKTSEMKTTENIVSSKSTSEIAPIEKKKSYPKRRKRKPVIPAAMGILTKDLEREKRKRNL